MECTKAQDYNIVSSLLHSICTLHVKKESVLAVPEGLNSYFWPSVLTINRLAITFKIKLPSPLKIIFTLPRVKPNQCFKINSKKYVKPRSVGHSYGLAYVMCHALGSVFRGPGSGL